MNIVVGLGEEDLYLTHRVVRVAGTFLHLLFGPCGIGRTQRGLQMMRRIR
jgi:hypothetical protein